MKDELRSSAFFLSHHKGISQEEMIDILLSKFTGPDCFLTCPICNKSIKWKKLLEHSIKKHQVKVSWNNIAIIQKQKEERRKIKKTVGKHPKATFVNGGAPGLKRS